MEQSVAFLKEKLVEPHFIKQLIDQINKDFYRATQVEAVPLEATVHEIVINVEIALKEIIHRDASKISTLLYLVDVPEIEVEQYLSATTENLLSVVTFLILKREFQKVYLRNKIL